MKNKKLILILMIAVAISAFGISCSKSVQTPTEQSKDMAANNVSKTENSSTSSATDTTNPVVKKDEKSVKDKKADFMVTAVSLNQEFRAKGKKDSDFSKYKNKVIEIGGVINTLYPEKKDSSQARLSFTDGGLGVASTCYFDDEESPKLKELKERQAVTLKCFLDEDDIYAGMPPSLRHCAVVK